MFTLNAELGSEGYNFKDWETKFEIKKANSRRNENTDIQQITENHTASKEDAAKVVYEFERIIRNKKSDIA